MASARAARSVQPSLARVGAAAAGVEPARRDTERRAMPRAGVASLAWTRTRSTTSA